MSVPNQTVAPPREHDSNDGFWVWLSSLFQANYKKTFGNEVILEKTNKYYSLKNISKKDLELEFLTEDPNKMSLQLLKRGELLAVRSRTLVRKINGSQVQSLIATRDLSIINLDLIVGKSYIIRNRTPRRIEIKHNSGKDQSLILPPFGSRVLVSNILSDYDFVPWVRQSLVTVDSVAQQIKNETILTLAGISVLLFIILLFGSFLLLFFNPDTGIVLMDLSLVSGIFMVFMLLTISFADRVKNLSELSTTLASWLKVTPGVVLVLLAGIGLPIGAVYFLDREVNLLNLERGAPASLGLVMLLTFTTVAAILPALLYYLFGRLQVQKQRDNFFREVLLLDPNIWSYSEAEDKYDPLMQSVYGSGNSPFAIMLLVISTILFVIGWVITLMPVNLGSVPNEFLINYFTPKLTPFTLGFLGAYFFAVQMIFRRYVRSDLTPKTYAYITVRLLTTLVLVWAISVLPLMKDNELAMLFAFAIGVFPEVGIQLIVDFIKKRVQGVKFQNNDEAYPLSDLEGMNMYDRARLLEEGIENVENLAHHNLVELIARTRIPTPRLLDMIDQAILYIHLGIGDQEHHQNGRKDKDRSAESYAEAEAGTDSSESQPEGAKKENKQDDEGRALLAELKSYGIRTATNLVDAMESSDGQTSCLEGNVSNQTLKRLKVIVKTLYQDEWLDYIRNWNALTRDKEVISAPHQFYQTLKKE